MSKERKRSNKSQPQGQEAPAATAAALDMNEGDIRDAVLNLIQNDQDIMRTIIINIYSYSRYTQTDITYMIGTSV